MPLDLSDDSKIDAEISRVITQIRLTEPFHAEIIAQISRRISDTTRTMGLSLCTDGLFLLINPNFIGSKLHDTKLCAALLRHEEMHLFLKHPFRMRQHENKKLFAIAASMECNAHLGQAWATIPDTITVDDFPELSLSPQSSAEFFYKKLDQLWQQLVATAHATDQQLADVDLTNHIHQQSAQRLRQLMLGYWHSDYQYWSGAKSSVNIHPQKQSSLGLIEQQIIDDEVERIYLTAREQLAIHQHQSIPNKVEQKVDGFLALRNLPKSEAPLFSQAHAELGRCIIQLLLEDPFYGHFLSGTIRQITDTISTAGVALRKKYFLLLVNPRFFLQELPTTALRMGVLKHEALHLMLKHIFQISATKISNKKLYNVAADLEVNQYIGPPLQLPDNAITLQTFPHYKLPKGRTAEEYYNILQEHLDSLHKKPPFLRNNSDKRLLDLQGNSWHSDHGKWHISGMDCPNKIERGLLESDLERHMIEAHQASKDNQHGLIPKRFEELIKKWQKRNKPQVNWRRKIRLFSASSARSSLTHTVRRKSKRFNSYPGVKIKRAQRLLLAIDTSGSIQPSHFEKFFTEIHGIYKNGAEIIILECDARVQRSYPYRGQTPQTISGRGGTRFDPVFRWINQQKKQIFDGCIYLTDGFADTPTVKPHCRLLWVLTAQGTPTNLPWGNIIKLPT